ncbi:MAG TPA: nucleoside diphosphate kinase regulator [Phycisphaerae bacterium]|nr:nucleoside diphosphate kinase regulator [Phycisphaerae bacterium]HOJ72354.1 nucleoside diphosphate kinase regulator [Phycisphaerae bacterium]HOM49984.1 nucleoside diphosphate kinase regulator [Phycisphaerae bacterium]HON66229.1 nucleoside diphosphate kinase regulator [Phycisphaerae bacterium]HOQ87428.1 nucleoside diphosphate kinase regulator [Phycisphaerae bacterium]
MARRSIYITQSDAARLRELLRVQMSSNPKDRPNLRVLDEELKRARLVEAHRVKPDVVTMHSRLLVEDVATGEAMEVTLVFPEEADAANGRISVVAPMGAALLGYRAGDTVEFAVPRGKRRMRIKEVLYQPEASGVPA